ncbi:hypothetical protein CCACVL1_20192 [Corchorus capsularis]|uniref:beta-glucosidase n=1 Tax=Corchorus capsularis TaxID=210143 RepID=A0A1R3HC71_COCAP|nr:hypothetical protein CCACVL1_20192 [Corchorus capsularis]
MARPRIPIFLMGLLLFSCLTNADEYVKYKDPKQPLQARIRDLLKRMTLEEKIGQMTQIDRSVASAEVMHKYFIETIGVVGFFSSAKARYMKYKDPKQPVEVRIQDLLKRMTLEEKVGQMTQIDRKVASADVMKKYFIASAKARYMKYRDPKQPVEVRIQDLLKKMTLEEKIGQMTQIDRRVASAEVMKEYFIGQ